MNKIRHLLPGISVATSFILSLVVFNACEKDDVLLQLERYTYPEGTLLTFTSALHTEEFIVQRVVNGKYEDSKSGTCAKPPTTVYEYQAVYLRPVDSVQRSFPVIGQYADDCGGYPKLAEGNGIAFLHGVYDPTVNDQINWLDEFYDKRANVTRQHTRLTIRSREFTNVIEFTVTSGKRLSAIYYADGFGFVGFALRNGEVFELSNP